MANLTNEAQDLLKLLAKKAPRAHRATACVDAEAMAELEAAGYVTEVRWSQYTITEAGLAAIAR